MNMWILWFEHYPIRVIKAWIPHKTECADFMHFLQILPTLVDALHARTWGKNENNKNMCFCPHVHHNGTQNWNAFYCLSYRVQNLEPQEAMQGTRWVKTLILITCNSEFENQLLIINKVCISHNGQIVNLVLFYTIDREYFWKPR